MAMHGCAHGCTYRSARTLLGSSSGSPRSNEPKGRWRCRFHHLLPGIVRGIVKLVGATHVEMHQHVVVWCE